MKPAFNAKSDPGARKPRIDSIINNSFDWEQAAFYGGLRISVEHNRAMIDNLQSEIARACPSVHDDAVFDLLRDLAWRRALPHPRETATEIAAAFVAAQDGDMHELHAVKHRLQRRIAFLEKHYDGGAPPAQDIPIHIVADIMDSDDGMRKIRTQEKLDYIAIKRKEKPGGPQPS